MKNKMPVFVGILITVLVFGLMFSGCKTEDDDVGDKIERNFEGIWRNTVDGKDIQYTFTGNTFTVRDNLTNLWYGGIFEYTDTTITFEIHGPGGTIDGKWDQEYEFKAKDILFIASDNVNHYYGTFVRQIDNGSEKSFDGIWKNTTNNVDIQYSFEGNTFTGRNNQSGVQFTGTFEYTNTAITFREIDEGVTTDEWTQDYEFRNNNEILYLAPYETYWRGEFVKQ